MVVFYINRCSLYCYIREKNNISSSTSNQTFNIKDCLSFFITNNLISDDVYVEAMYMDNNELNNFIFETVNNMNDANQQLFMNQMHIQQQTFNDMLHNQMIFDQILQNQTLHDHIQMSTGIEFGGFNSDINLNPSQLDHDMFNNQMMNDNSMHNMF